MGKVRVKGRFYVVVTLTVAAIVLLVYFIINGRKEGTVGSGTVNMEFSIDAVVVRDEAPMTTEKFDRIIFSAAEGAYIEEGKPVAQVYKIGYNDDMMQSLLSIQEKILQEQLKQLSGVSDDQLNSLNSQIDTRLQQMRLRAFGEPADDLLEIELSLKQLLQERRDYLKGKVQETQELSALYEQEARQLEQLSTYRGDILSAGTGRISFYFDYFENVINCNQLEFLTHDLIKLALSGASGGNTMTETLLYRLVNDTHYCIAFLTSASGARRLVEGETYEVTFDVDPGMTHTGVAKTIDVSAAGVINIIEFEEPVGRLLSIRKTKATIRKSATGSIVPVEAVSVNADYQTGVVIKLGDLEHFIAVDVLAMDEEKAVVRAKNPTETVAMGQKYVKAG